jgi:hypothetical protein
MALKKNTQSKVVRINSNGAKAIDELERKKKWHEQEKQQAGWLPSDVELAGKIQAIIHAADKYRELIEARPFEVNRSEAGADSVLWAGIKLWNLTRLLDSTIEGFSRRANKAAEEKQ